MSFAFLAVPHRTQGKLVASTNLNNCSGPFGGYGFSSWEGVGVVMAFDIGWELSVLTARIDRPWGMAIPTMRITILPRPTYVALSICLAAASLSVEAVETSASGRSRIDAHAAASQEKSKAEYAAMTARRRQELAEQVATFGAICGQQSVSAGALPAVTETIRNGVLLVAAPGHLTRELGVYAVDFDRQVLVKVTQHLLERMTAPAKLFGGSVGSQSCRLLHVRNGQTRLEVTSTQQVPSADIEVTKGALAALEARERGGAAKPTRDSSWTGCSGARLSSAVAIPVRAGKRLPELCAEVGNKDLEALFTSVTQPFRQALPK